MPRGNRRGEGGSPIGDVVINCVAVTGGLIALEVVTRMRGEELPFHWSILVILLGGLPVFGAREAVRLTRRKRSG